MEKFSREHLRAIAPGIRLFNAQKYWECHEELEGLWLEERGSARFVYWAVIQVAAAMIHYRDKNLIGAQGLIKKARLKFERCIELNVESEVLESNLSWQELKELVFKVPDNSNLEDFKELYDFKFKDPGTWT